MKSSTAYNWVYASEMSDMVSNIHYSSIDVQKVYSSGK